MGRSASAAPAPAVGARLAAGAAVVRGYLGRLGTGPGVYRMLNAKGEPLYVGKASNLRNRVATYARPERLPIRLQRMVAETASMEFVSTASEVEALLLENNLIKRLAPRYNVLLRDDKTFPDIWIRTDHPYPQILKHRGARREPGAYFGPFASAGAVNRMLNMLQRAFLLRNCSDAVFANRTRPCLQYQIKRCSAPCVGRIGEADYAETVAQAKAFLSGRGKEIHDRLAADMQAASEALDFERAALLRDRIRAIAHVQSHQDINVEGVADADIVALHQAGGQSCIQAFFFRGGRNNGNRAYFPSHDSKMERDQLIAAFLGQFYEDRPPPKLVLLNQEPAERALLEEALALKAGRKVEVVAPKRGGRRSVVQHAETNAREALERRLAESASQRRLLDGLAELAGIGGGIERVEVYDNSHIAGTKPVGAMIVAGPDGLQKKEYRKFNIRAGRSRDAVDAPAAQSADDYAMMREVFERRFGRALKEDPDRDGGSWPDLVLIDGGKGQLSSAVAVLEDLGLAGEVPILAVAKGPEREAGRERLILPGRDRPILLPPRDPVLYFIQRLRDEAHRFAIGSHRQRRTKALGDSPLDEVPGVGAKRKKALLLHFGSAKAVARAGLADLQRVDGVSATVARRIYDHFHPNG
ncbi:MAG: excinuclease ABC subunit UvrC [Alphaproteobacteria bacterium]|nr:excinuclease ABC subunit UvrC [Alphaproteobacteria bacterium]